MRSPGLNNRDNSLHFRLRIIPIMFIAQGVFRALILSVGILFIAASILNLTQIPEYYSPGMIFIATAGGILYGSWYAGKNAGNRGWLNGGLVGIIYSLLVLVVGMLVFDKVGIEINLLSKFFLGAVLGAAGGMWGVNS